MAAQFHVKAKSAWKSVDISQAGLSQKDLDGFFSFEELTDYEIIGSGEKNGKKNKKNATKNKQAEEKDESLNKQAEEKDESLNITKQDSPKKKRRKRKKKSKAPKNDESCSENNNKEKQKKKFKKNNKVILKADLQTIEDINATMENEGNSDAKTSQDVITNKDKRKRKSPDMKSDEMSQKKKSKLDAEKTDQKTGTQPLNKSLKGMGGWKDLFVPDEVLWALRDEGFEQPTPIQSQILPSAIRDQMDVVGAAETGSGKTLAFGIPIIHFILKQKKAEADRLLRNLNGESSDEGDLPNDDDVEQSDDGEEIEEDNSDSEDLNEIALDENEDNDDDEVSNGEEEAEDEDQQHEDMTDDMSEDAESINDNDDEESSEEEFEDTQQEGHGCVKVIKDVDFDWLGESDVKRVATHPRALILQPTRELAIQVKNHLLAAAKYTDVTIAAIVGGLALPKQRRILKRCPDVLVATPGRLWEMIQQGEVYLSEIEKTCILVVDEADRMVEKGHYEELAKLLEMMKRDPDRENRHTYVFSATLTMVHSGPQRIMKKKKNKYDEKQKLAYLMKKMGLKEKPKIVDLTRKVGTVESLTEARIHCTKEEKDIYLYYFLKHYPGRTLVFANSKDCIRRLVSIFQILQCSPLPLHADMHQRQRLKNLDRFTSNPNALLMASDVAARGLDIPNVQHVIHYQVPHTVENYVHRSGRTARASREGLSIMIVGPDDSKNYKKIMHTLNKSEDLPGFPVEQQSLTELRRRVNLVRQIETQEYRFNKSKRHNDWFVKAAEEIGVDIDDEGLLDDIGSDVEQARHKQYIKQMKAELSFLLRQPLQIHTTMTKYPTKTGKLVDPSTCESLGDAMSNVKKSKTGSELLKHASNTSSPKKGKGWKERCRDIRMKKKMKKAMKGSS